MVQSSNTKEERIYQVSSSHELAIWHSFLSLGQRGEIDQSQIYNEYNCLDQYHDNDNEHNYLDHYHDDDTKEKQPERSLEDIEALEALVDSIEHQRILCGDRVKILEDMGKKAEGLHRSLERLMQGLDKE